MPRFSTVRISLSVRPASVSERENSVPFHRLSAGCGVAAEIAEIAQSFKRDPPVHCDIVHLVISVEIGYETISAR